MEYHDTRILIADENASCRAQIREALTRAGRTDLIGFTSDCLVRPAVGTQSTKSIEKTRTRPQKSGHASAHYGKGAPSRNEKRSAQKPRKTDTHSTKKARSKKK